MREARTEARRVLAVSSSPPFSSSSTCILHSSPSLLPILSSRPARTLPSVAPVSAGAADVHFHPSKLLSPPVPLPLLQPHRREQPPHTLRHTLQPQPLPPHHHVLLLPVPPSLPSLLLPPLPLLLSPLQPPLLSLHPPLLPPHPPPLPLPPHPPPHQRAQPRVLPQQRRQQQRMQRWGRRQPTPGAHRRVRREQQRQRPRDLSTPRQVRHHPVQTLAPPPLAPRLLPLPPHPPPAPAPGPLPPLPPPAPAAPCVRCG